MRYKIVYYATYDTFFPMLAAKAAFSINCKKRGGCKKGNLETKIWINKILIEKIITKLISTTLF